jgi:hypothetical protein
LSPNISWGILPEQGIVLFLDLSKLQEQMSSSNQYVPQTETQETQEEESE